MEERTYNIPLRKEFLKVPKYVRAKKTVKAVKEYLMKHTKKEDIKLGNRLNEKVWEHGIKNPPHHVKVTARIDKETVYAELEGFTFVKTEKKPEKQKNLVDKVKEKIGASPKKPKAEKKPSVKKEEKKVEETKVQESD